MAARLTAVNHTLLHPRGVQVKAVARCEVVGSHTALTITGQQQETSQLGGPSSRRQLGRPSSRNSQSS